MHRPDRSLLVIGTDCIGSCKSNYHTITDTMALQFLFMVYFLYKVLDLAESRGGRFGSRSRSSSRYRSKVRSSRYSQVSRVQVRTKYSDYRLGIPYHKKGAINAGTVYGARLWKRSSTYRRHHSCKY